MSNLVSVHISKLIFSFEANDTVPFGICKWISCLSPEYFVPSSIIWKELCLFIHCSIKWLGKSSMLIRKRLSFLMNNVLCTWVTIKFLLQNSFPLTLRSIFFFGLSGWLYLLYISGNTQMIHFDSSREKFRSQHGHSFYIYKHNLFDALLIWYIL